MFSIEYAAAVALAMVLAQGDGNVQKAADDSAAVARDCVEVTVYVPQWVTEVRTCTETRYRTEKQQKECVTYKCVPVTKQVPYKYTVWVREMRDDIQTFEVDTPVCRWVDQKYHEYLPSKMTVTRYHTRTECQPVTVKKKVCEDHGHYEEKVVDHCDKHGHKSSHVCQVWVPQIVEKEVEVTEDRMVTIKEPYQCQVDICVPVERVRKVKVWETKTEKKSVNHPYETIVPKERVQMVEVCVTEEIPETHVEEVEVCVPYTVEVQKEVRVCKMVPKTIRVPACGACGACGQVGKPGRQAGS